MVGFFFLERRVTCYEMPSHAERISLKLAVEYLKNLVRGTQTVICCDCGYVNLEDNFMKFTKQVLEGVNCRGQKDFSPGGTHGG